MSKIELKSSLNAKRLRDHGKDGAGDVADYFRLSIIFEQMGKISNSKRTAAIR